jgi:hypothetical protein
MSPRGRTETVTTCLRSTPAAPLARSCQSADLELDDLSNVRRVLCELREAVLEQVGKDETDRLRHALSDAVKVLSA